MAHATPAAPIPQLDYRDALAIALAAFPKPATTDSSMTRASAFVCFLAGAVSGYGDQALGAKIMAVVQPPQPTAAGAA